MAVAETLGSQAPALATSPAQWRSRRALGAGTARLAAASLLLGAASSHAWTWEWVKGSGPGVKGSGKIVKTSRSLGAFRGISLEAPAQVTLVQGGPGGLVIETDDNIAPLLETVVERDHLLIRFARNAGPLSAQVLNVTISLPAGATPLESLAVGGSGVIKSALLTTPSLQCAIGGSGDIHLAQLQTDKFKVSIAGSGSLTAAGRADDMTANIAGAGDLKTGKLAAQHLKISIAGSGDATVWAKTGLNVSIAGSGDVGYFGDPAVKQSIAGSGNVRRLGPGPAD